MIEQLVARVFATRNAAHIAHWKTRSFAEHEALGAFASALVDKIDEIVESYQGTHTLINHIPDYPPLSVERIIAHIDEEAKWIDNVGSKIAAGSPSVQNLLDELHGIYAKTLYKLKHLD